jgi:hypothetical protein
MMKTATAKKKKKRRDDDDPFATNGADRIGSFSIDVASGRLMMMGHDDDGW